MEATKMEALHPYYPQTMELPGFYPAVMSQLFILSVYGGASLLVIIAVWLISGKYTRVSTLERYLMCWFAFSGLTHIVLEGYFVFTPDFYKLTEPNFLAEVWKEYSKADSRYVGRDATVVCVEGITAVLAGPGCLLAVYAIGAQTTYHYTLQLAVSVGQLYGDIMYFVTVILEGKEHSAPSPVYYWFYYIFMNNIWVVIPLYITIRSWSKISEAFERKKKQQ